MSSGNGEKLCLTVKEAAKLCGICENSMRILVHSKDFPMIKVGRRILIVKDAFLHWLNTAYQKNGQ
jgi:excisionase family DNA binding protein